MDIVTLEAATAKNRRPGPSGVSPAMHLFGLKLRLPAEVYEDGIAPGVHHDVIDESSEPAPESSEPAPESSEPAPESSEPAPESSEPAPESGAPTSEAAGSSESAPESAPEDSPKADGESE